jgi:hypothetical protein
MIASSLLRLELTLGDGAFNRPNATRQARRAAGARHERTLEAVACTRLFGAECHTAGGASAPAPPF